jgi:DNA-directed RNA polymerase specialized sigma24 family protein
MTAPERALEVLQRQADELLSAGDTVGARRMLAAHDRALAQLRGEVEAISAADLEAANRAVEDAERTLRQARAGRREAIQTAIADGWTYQRIGEVLGITRSRVSQLAAERSE